MKKKQYAKENLKVLKFSHGWNQSVLRVGNAISLLKAFCTQCVQSCICVK